MQNSMKNTQEHNPSILLNKTVGAKFAELKCSLGISNFLEEISSLSHSIGVLYFFALITEEGFLVSPCYSLELCIQMGIPFLFPWWLSC